MTDINNPDGTTQTPNDGDNGATQSPKTEDKVFTQDQLNSIVEGRLAKEREKFKDYDAFKTKAGEYDQLKQKHDSFESQLATSNATLQSVFDNLTTGITDEKKALIPEQLSLQDKLNYVIKNKSVLIGDAVTPPVTPSAPKEPKGDAGLYGGKYKTLLEWAEKDPKSYLEAKQAK